MKSTLMMRWYFSTRTMGTAKRSWSLTLAWSLLLWKYLLVTSCMRPRLKVWCESSKKTFEPWKSGSRFHMHEKVSPVSSDHHFHQLLLSPPSHDYHRHHRLHRHYRHHHHNHHHHHHHNHHHHHHHHRHHHHNHHHHHHQYHHSTINTNHYHNHQHLSLSIQLTFTTSATARSSWQTFSNSSKAAPILLESSP